MTATARTRVEKLLVAARQLADPNTELGRRARRELPEQTGLSPENVELCLSRHLEVQVDGPSLEALCAVAPGCRKAHVLLSANVFTAPLRAIALALAQSARVDVRPSRRQPLFTKLLYEASGGAFRIVEDLVPSPDDHVWAYGRDDSLESIRDEMPAGVVFHAHASGFGIAVVGEHDSEAAGEIATSIVGDVVPFDQRGCLSPRIVLVQGSDEAARSLAEHLAQALLAARQDVPLGVMTDDEAAEVTRYRDTMTYAGLVFPAGKGLVGFDEQGSVLLAPVGRSLHVARVEELSPALEQIESHITSVGAPIGLHKQLAALLPHARIAELGRQQRPPLDGPVDRRESTTGELL